MERVRKEMGFHGRFRAVIRLAVFSETIQLFDAVIVCRMIYDFKLHNLFMLLFFQPSLNGSGCMTVFLYKYLHE